MERIFTLGLSNAVAAAVLAIGVAAVGRPFSRRPAVLHCLWLLVLLKLVTPPLFEVPIVVPAAEPAPAEFARMVLDEPDGAVGEEPGTVAEVPDEGFLVLEPTVRPGSRPADPMPSWQWALAAVGPWLGSAWLVGSGIVLILAAVRVARFRRVLAESYPAPHEVQALVERLAGRLGLRRSPQAWFIDTPLMPMLWAVACRPRLIIPSDLWESLGQSQRSLLLAHELAHLHRGDHLLRLFELLVTALYWWFPVAWWARHALRDAEEQCCDAWVIWAFPDEARTYAETLLDTVDFLNPTRVTEPLLASGFGRARHLRRRLTMIMLGTTPRRLGWASALGAFSLSAALLPLTPSWAQKPQEKFEAHALAIEVKDEADAKADQAEKSQVEVVVATDGEVEKVQAGSMDKAVDAIKKRIEALAKESGGSDKHAAQIKALKQALEAMQKAAPKVFEYKVEAPGGVDPHGEKRVYLRHVETVDKDADPKLAAEKAAKLDKARARVNTLKKELADKRQQLVEAERDLAKLAVATKTLRLRVSEPNVVLHKLPAKPGGSTTVNPAHSAKLELHLASPDSKSSLSPSDRERLESLEKKLARLLDEVANLKKHEDKGK